MQIREVVARVVALVVEGRVAATKPRQPKVAGQREAGRGFVAHALTRIRSRQRYVAQWRLGGFAAQRDVLVKCLRLMPTDTDCE
jgi:hypothetical protein